MSGATITQSMFTKKIGFTETDVADEDGVREVNMIYRME